MKQNKIQSNPRYPNFKQTLFHAGDEEQFERYRSYKNSKPLSNKNIYMEEISQEEISPLYHNLDSFAVTHTFEYIFHKFKKGIFIKIRDNQVETFLPFSKANFKNEWSHRLTISKSYNGDFLKFIQYICGMENRKFYPRYINKYSEQWYANNYLLRYEYPIHEGDTNVCLIKHMFETLCQERKIPDMEFFVNRRDFPILTNDYTEPYNEIWDSNHQPLVSYCFSTYSPILSMCTGTRFADLGIPTWEDWIRVNPDVTFTRKNYHADKYDDECFDITWTDKIPTAIFRGSSTGRGVTIETNPRLKIAYLSLKSPKHNGIPILDAGITKWNLRPRKLEGVSDLQTIDIHKLPFGLVEKIEPYGQSRYKYIVHIEGHVSAFRLSLELAMGSVLLIVQSSWKLWYSDILKPYYHYIPIKSDLSNLIEMIQWCIEHDSECEQISKNAKQFYDTYLNRSSILDFLQKRLFAVKQKTGTYFYNAKSPLSLQIQEQSTFPMVPINNVLPSVAIISSLKNIETFYERSYGKLRALEWIIYCKKNQLVFKKEIFSNKYSKISLFTILDISLAIKQTSKEHKKEEYIHEWFVGTRATNLLSKYIPNFVYTFGMLNQDQVQQEPDIHLITEYVEGETLFSYLQSSKFSVNEYLFILFQIACSLQIAQKHYQFVHYDLTPWNIIIRRVSNPISCKYTFSENHTICFTSHLIPVIIDFGKSHVVVNQKHYGYIKIYQPSFIQDIFSILVTSLGTILQYQKLNKSESILILQLSNFLTGTLYRKQPFRNIYELKNFVRVAKKYSELIHSDKKDLEQRSPLDFISYLLKMFNVYQPIQPFLVPRHNTRQILDFLLVENTLETFISFFHHIRNNLYFPTQKVFLYYSGQQILDEFDSVRNSFLKQKRSSSVHSYLGKLRNEIIMLYQEKIRLCASSGLKTPIENIKPLRFDETIFHDPVSIVECLTFFPMERHSSEYVEILGSVLEYTNELRIKDDMEQQEYRKIYHLVKKEYIKYQEYSSLLDTAQRLGKENIHDPCLPLFWKEIYQWILSMH